MWLWNFFFLTTISNILPDLYHFKKYILGALIFIKCGKSTFLLWQKKYFFFSITNSPNIPCKWKHNLIQIRDLLWIQQPSLVWSALVAAECLCCWLNFCVTLHKTIQEEVQSKQFGELLQTSVISGFQNTLLVSFLLRHIILVTHCVTFFFFLHKDTIKIFLSSHWKSTPLLSPRTHFCINTFSKATNTGRDKSMIWLVYLRSWEISTATAIISFHWNHRGFYFCSIRL